MIYDIEQAGMLKRVSAWLLDAILLLVLATGAMAGLAHLLDLDTHSQEMTAIYDRYEEEYNISYSITQGEMANLTEEQAQAYAAANEALAKDTHAQAVYEQLVNTSLLTVTIGFLVAFVILELIVPLLLKNGQTLGKKTFGLALVRKDCVRVTPFMLFARTVLGKYTVETMLPLLLLLLMFFGLFGTLGSSILMIFLVVHVVLPMVTRNHSAIHDYMARTVVVDFNSQMIFASADELLEYKKRVQADAANEADY